MADTENLFNQLLDIWRDAESYCEEEVLFIYEELAKKIISNGSTVGKHTLELIKQMRLNNNKCPDCSSDLITKSHIINYGEARGMDYEEIGSYLYCPQCKWKEED